MLLATIGTLVFFGACTPVDSLSSEDRLHKVLSDLHKPKIEEEFNRIKSIVGVWSVDTLFFEPRTHVGLGEWSMLNERMVISDDFKIYFLDTNYEIHEIHTKSPSRLAGELNVIYRYAEMLGDDIADMSLYPIPNTIEPSLSVRLYFACFLSKDGGFYIWTNSETSEAVGMYRLRREE
jgi:hypothetical protein